MIRIVAWGMVVAALIASSACGGEVRADGPGKSTTYKVYFLAGQSNMEGYGKAGDLPAELKQPVEGAFIFHGRVRKDGLPNTGIGRWQMLQPGFGKGFDTSGKRNRLSNRFGPELSFGRRMRELQPDETIAIIKYARGGTALIDGVSSYGSWDPDYSGDNGQNQYDHALAALRSAFDDRDVDGDGVTDRLVPAGIVWLQGEADANDKQAALQYRSNLVRLMDLFRAALRQDDLPLVIGQIKDSGDTPETHMMQFSPEVRAQQQSFVEADACAALVAPTDEFGFLPDGWHYLSDDYLTLGEAFAEAMVALEERC